MFHRRFTHLRLFGSLLVGLALVGGCGEVEPVEDDFEVEVEDGQVQEVEPETDLSEDLGVESPAEDPGVATP